MKNIIIFFIGLICVNIYKNFAVLCDFTLMNSLSSVLNDSSKIIQKFDTSNPIYYSDKDSTTDDISASNYNLNTVYSKMSLSPVIAASDIKVTIPTFNYYQDQIHSKKKYEINTLSNYFFKHNGIITGDSSLKKKGLFVYIFKYINKEFKNDFKDYELKIPQQLLIDDITLENCNLEIINTNKIFSLYIFKHHFDQIINKICQTILGFNGKIIEWKNINHIIIDLINELIKLEERTKSEHLILDRDENKTKEELIQSKIALEIQMNLNKKLLKEKIHKFKDFEVPKVPLTGNDIKQRFIKLDSIISTLNYQEATIFKYFKPDKNLKLRIVTFFAANGENAVKHCVSLLKKEYPQYFYEFHTRMKIVHICELVMGDDGEQKNIDETNVPKLLVRK